MIKTSDEKYITLKNGEPAIPTGQTRVNENGETEAQVICFMCSGAFRDVWVQRKDVGQGVLSYQHVANTTKE